MSCKRAPYCWTVPSVTIHQSIYRGTEKRKSIALGQGSPTLEFFSHLQAKHKQKAPVEEITSLPSQAFFSIFLASYKIRSNVYRQPPYLDDCHFPTAQPLLLMANPHDLPSAECLHCLPPSVWWAALGFVNQTKPETGTPPLFCIICGQEQYPHVNCKLISPLKLGTQ